MLNLLRQIGRRLRRAGPALADARMAAGGRYRSAIPALESRDVASLEKLAQAPHTAPEVLYYLADDPTPEVRRLVAANPATPMQADRALADDSDAEVRCALARKIGRLVPDLDASTQEKLHRQAIELLERLAQDRLAQVRRIVAEEIKRTPNVPRPLVRRLAQDVESVVCTPVLRYSPLLRDEDLVEIIAATTAEGALSAIASRDQVGPDVADAIVATVDVPAVAALLANSGAQIRAETLDVIIEEAQAIREWHTPLVVRADLSLRAVRRIAGFVGSALIEEMAKLHDLDAETAQVLALRVRERLRQETFEPEAGDPSRHDPDTMPLEALDDRAIGAAAEAGQADFVTRALARRAGIPVECAARIMAARSGRAVTALVWKAGLGMRLAVKVQQHLLRLPAAATVFARQGLYYPLTPEEMTVQLELFGIPGATLRNP